MHNGFVPRFISFSFQHTLCVGVYYSKMSSVDANLHVTVNVYTSALRLNVPMSQMSINLIK